MEGDTIIFEKKEKACRCTFLFFKLSVLVIFFNIDIYKNTLISSCIFFLDKEKNCPRINSSR